MFFKDLNYLKVTSEYKDILEDVSDVFQAVYTLFKTKKGSRLFRPNYGANLSRYMFEPCDEFTARSIMYDITEAIKEEPRVSLNSESYVVADPENRRFIIHLVLDIQGFTQPQTLNLVLEQKG